MPKCFSLLFFAAALTIAVFLPVKASSVSAQSPRSTPLTITVDSADDPDGSMSHTCTFGNASYEPAQDGKCTLRRAIVEATARPQSDRPITIVFNLSKDDPNYGRDASDTWTILLSDVLPPLKTSSATPLDGQVTIDGATQPGGRNNGPPILINMGDRVWEIGSANNQLRNLALLDGGSLLVTADGNLIEHEWLGLSADGQSIRLREPSDPRRLATRGIQILSSRNIVRNNTIAGAFTPAIHISGNGTTGNQILQNQIGLRADGSLPTIAENIVCLRSLTYSSANWYGGRGISLAGNGHIVSGNRIAGLHLVQAPFEKPPTALAVAGTNHVVAGNVIGLDQADNPVGVCGQALEIVGNGIEVVDNTIVRSRSGFADTAGNALNSAILAGDSSIDFGSITVRRNIVNSGPGAVYAFSPLTAEGLRKFAPARITAITDTLIVGGNGIDAAGDTSPCPNCTVDFYLDDTDDIGETLAHLGSATADVTGAFTFTLPQALAANQGIRTASTVTSAGVGSELSAGTTSLFSGLYLKDISVEILGPTEGETDEFLSFSIKVTPADLATPLTLSISSTDNDALVGTVNTTTNLVAIRWAQPGLKTITVGIENGLSIASDTHQVQIVDGRVFIYLPNVSQ